LQQSGAFTHGATPILGIGRAVVFEPLLVAQELLPGDVTGVGVVPHNRTRPADHVY
jgi:hypothetical protein